MTEKEAMQLSKEYADNIFMENTSSHLCAQAGFYHGVMACNAKIESLERNLKLAKQTCDAQNMLLKSRWISVTEALPKEDPKTHESDTVLVRCVSGCGQVYYKLAKYTYNTNPKAWLFADSRAVTAWRPIPKDSIMS